MSTSTLEVAEILDAIAETIVVLNPDGGVLYANRAVLEYTGLTMPDVLAGDFLSRRRCAASAPPLAELAALPLKSRRPDSY